MKAAKIFAGILQLPIAIFIIFQTYSAWSQIMTTDTIQSIVYSAFVIASCYLITGIINLLSTKAKTFVPDIIYALLLLIGWFVARNDTAGFKFLNLWAWIGLVLGIAILATHIILVKLGRYDDDTTTSSPNRQRGHSDTVARSRRQSTPDHGTQETQQFYQNYNNNYPPRANESYAHPSNQPLSRATRQNEPLPSRAQLRAKKSRRSKK